MGTVTVLADWRASHPQRDLRIGDRVRLAGKPSRIGTVIGSLLDGSVLVSWGLFYSDTYRPSDLERID